MTSVEQNLASSTYKHLQVCIINNTDCNYRNKNEHLLFTLVELHYILLLHFDNTTTKSCYNYEKQKNVKERMIMGSCTKSTNAD